MTKKIIALVGRPNVGKSTLFNRLSVKKKALVHDRPGVTRDRKYADAQIGSFEFQIIDTPGLEEAEEGKLENRMMQQTQAAILEADLICLIVDGRAGVTPIDRYFASFIRKYNQNCIMVVNKCEKKFDFDEQFYKLGYGEPVPISAEHGTGLADLYETIIEKMPEDASDVSTENIVIPKNDPGTLITVVGRPNAGKSTFINALIGEERLLTGPEAGITRESVDIDIVHAGHKIKLVDTAGLRKRATIEEQLEKLSASDTINSINFANTVVLMLDAERSLEQQDLNIAYYIIEQGRSLVIAVNKWDLVKDKEAFKEEFFYQLEHSMGQVKGISVIFMSALTKDKIGQVLDECIKAYGYWNKKISTSSLNNWLNFITEHHPLPLQKSGRRIRIKYMTQIKTRPPTFKLFCNQIEGLTDGYKRYLANALRESFGIPGVPIRFILNKNSNPYIKKS